MSDASNKGSDHLGPEPRANNPHNLSPGAEAMEQTESAAARRERSGGVYGMGKSAGRNRWLLLIVGGVTVLAGLLALAMPFVASLAAALLAGWVLIASGIVGLVTAFRRRDGWHIAAAFALAVVAIIAGGLILAQPISGILALTTLLIAYFAASGILRIYYGAKMRGDGGGWMIAAGALSFVLALLVWFGLPFSATWVPGMFLGIDLVIWGVLQIAMALRLERGTRGTERHA